MRGLTNLRREVIEDMSSFASGELSGLLKDPDTNWQPQDWLPHPERDDFLDQVRETRARSRRRRGSRDAAGGGEWGRGGRRPIGVNEGGYVVEETRDLCSSMDSIANDD